MQTESEAAEPDLAISEESRTRGRFKKTPLEYLAEFDSPFLSVSSNGQVLTCEACNIVLCSLEAERGKRSDVHKHLLKDPEHRKNAEIFLEQRNGARSLQAAKEMLKEVVVEAKEDSEGVQETSLEQPQPKVHHFLLTVIENPPGEAL